MSDITSEELQELEELRAFKRLHEGSQLAKAFYRLEMLLDAPMQQRCDTVMSARAFRVMAEALIALRDEVSK